MSSTSKDAQPPAGAEEGRGDSSQDQSHVTRPAEQAQGETGSIKKKKMSIIVITTYLHFLYIVWCDFSLKKGP